MSRLLSKNNRVLLLIALMFVSSFVVGGAVFLMTSAQSDEIDAVTNRLTVVGNIDDRISRAVEDQESALDDYVLSRNGDALQRYQAAVQTETAAEPDIQAAVVGLPEVASAFEAVRTASADWREKIATPAITAVANSDKVRIDGFAATTADDHVAVTEALNRVERSMARATAELNRQESGVATTTMVGTVFAFIVLILAFGIALVVVRRFGHALERDANESSVLNKFTEVTSFASDDSEVAATNLVALGRLVKPDASVIHILNRSMDRAVPESSTGDAIAEILPMRALDRCAGVVRGAMFVSDDLADDLSVHCPIYPADSGTLACIPLASGEMVGAVHLYWRKRRALPLASRSNIARITEHAALAIGNRRLLAALHGQATTDPRTGLANSRAFDEALETALAKRTGSQTVSVLMLDIDHFKRFNDRHGHPAGDEALRAFASVLRACMRDGDLAARYGGEEFAVLLPGADEGIVPAIAERIRARIEATIISLSAGVTDHITVSIGIATAPEHGVDRVTLLRLADEALYRAKDNGRNQVVRVTDRRATRASDKTPAAAHPQPIALPAVTRTVGRSRDRAATIPAEA